MTRHLLTTSLAVLLAAVVGAQAPRALLPQQQAELYKKNRVVITRLVDKTVESARSPNNYVTRAGTYYDLLTQFHKDIAEARRQNDDARVAELTEYLTLLLEDGLGPTLDRARQQVEGGTGEDEYLKVRADLLAQFDTLVAAFDEGTPTRTALDKARQRLLAIQVPKQK